MPTYIIQTSYYADSYIKRSEGLRGCGFLVMIGTGGLGQISRANKFAGFKIGDGREGEVEREVKRVRVRRVTGDDECLTCMSI